MAVNPTGRRPRSAQPRSLLPMTGTPGADSVIAQVASDLAAGWNRVSDQAQCRLTFDQLLAANPGLTIARSIDSPIVSIQINGVRYAINPLLNATTTDDVAAGWRSRRPSLRERLTWDNPSPPEPLAATEPPVEETEFTVDLKPPALARGRFPLAPLVFDPDQT